MCAMSVLSLQSHSSLAPSPSFILCFVYLTKPVMGKTLHGIVKCFHRVLDHPKKDQVATNSACLNFCKSICVYLNMSVLRTHSCRWPRVLKSTCSHQMTNLLLSIYLLLCTLYPESTLAMSVVYTVQVAIYTTIQCKLQFTPLI